jgi:hypothetical protein
MVCLMELRYGAALREDFEDFWSKLAEKVISQVQILPLGMRGWLETNPDEELAKDVRAQLTSEPERYAAYTREYLGWGAFALMKR